MLCVKGGISVTNVIVAFPKPEDAKSIRNILVKNGFPVVAVCTSVDWERTGVFHARKGGERNENGGDPCPQGTGGPAAKTFPYLRHTGQSRDIGWDRYFPDTRKDWLP